MLGLNAKWELIPNSETFMWRCSHCRCWTYHPGKRCLNCWCYMEEVEFQ